MTSHSLLKERLADVLTTLTERERNILEMRFGLIDGQARSCEQISGLYNVTRERIRQIEGKALRKLVLLELPGRFSLDDLRGAERRQSF